MLRSASTTSPLLAPIRAAVDTEPSTRLLATQAMPISAVPKASSSNRGVTNANSIDGGAALAVASAGEALHVVTEYPCGSMRFTLASVIVSVDP